MGGKTFQGHTSLKKEIGFIESYISLMQLRFSKHVTVEMDVPDGIPDINIPPMLFISLLENSFKHGVSYQKDSFVIFKIEINENWLNCTIKNSKQNKTPEVKSKYSGIGLTNIKKSLELHFGKNYLYEVEESETEYRVHLNVPFG